MLDGRHERRCMWWNCGSDSAEVPASSQGAGGSRQVPRPIRMRLARAQVLAGLGVFVRGPASPASPARIALKVTPSLVSRERTPHRLG